MRLQIAMMCPGMAFDGHSLTTHSLGGSETAALCMARELAKLGNRVTMFNNCKTPGECDGVNYLPVSGFQDFAAMVPHDIAIVQRMPQVFSQRINSRLNILWQHDLALGRNTAQFNGVLWNIDKVITVSDWMSKQYQQVYGDLCASALWSSRNGVDLEMFAPRPLDEREPGKLIYTARPERGLDVLLQKVLPRILERRPDAKLYVAAYNNQVEHLREFYAECSRLLDSFGDRIVWLGHLTKPELYEHYATAMAYVYPCPSPVNPEFHEVSCITAMECMAAGLPFLATDRGALSETLGDAGALVKDKDFDALADLAIETLNSPDLWTSTANAGLRRAKDLSWTGVAKEWNEQFREWVVERNCNTARLAHHLIRNSDIIAAKELLRNDHSKTALKLKERLSAEWGFIDSKDSYREQYERIGKTHTDIFDNVASEPRLRAQINWLKGRPELVRIGDIGCGLGAYAVHVSNALPDRKITGIDIDKHAIEWAKRYRSTKARFPDNLEFVCGDESAEVKAGFDCVIAQEIMEHTVDPSAFLVEIEAKCKKGGTVYITVPYGPWEHMSYETYPYRAHLWHFDSHDLEDLLGHKPDLSIQSLAYGVNHITKDPIGWHIITYTADHSAPGKIDMERKLRFQRPRQTVSATVMAGPNCEETLLWSLRSYRAVVDELIIADCGMSDLAKAMAEQYGAKLIVSDSPLKIGFDGPRNAALAHAKCDWVLWIDTDEKLLGAPDLHKYLRENVYNGYGIRQHHFAVDTQFNPDMPVRLFRNRPHKGKVMQFHGAIHEHPELALNEGPGPVIVISDVNIGHVGYLTEETRRGRFARNYPMLLKDQERYPDRLLQKHFIMRDEMLLAGYELQQNGGVLTQQIQERCKKTIALYREYFQDKKGYVNVDSLQYYSQALRILGVGFDVHIDLKAGKDGHGGVNGTGMRFANQEDLMIELKRRAEEATQAYDNPWW